MSLGIDGHFRGIAMARPRFSATNFLIRWLVALILVFATFNPTDYSYYRWVTAAGDGNLAFKALAGVALVILYVIFMRATWRSIGPIGLALAAAFFGTIVWVMIDLGLLDADRPTLMTYVILVILGTILAVGISWSHIRRRVSGQADIDDVDE
jgi:predicted neutral ceramidase superfamily lipid hydrolase